MSYYLEDHPNTNLAQYGWPRTKVSGVIGVHTTESGVDFEGPDLGVENTAAFIGRRTDYGSYHVMADYDSRLKLVRPTFAAWADTTNNVHAMSVSGAMNAARWRDLSPERAAGIVRNMGIAAAELVQDAIAHGVLDSAPPARRITAQQAIDGSAAGFYGHGETNPGTRYDPGTNFDWGLFLSTYASAVGTNIEAQSTTLKEWDELATKAEIMAAFHEELKTSKTQQLIRDAIFSELGSVRTRTKLQNAVWTQAGGERNGKLVTMWRDMVDTNTIVRTLLATVQDLGTKIGKPVDVGSLDADAVVDAIAERLSASAKETEPTQEVSQ